MLLESIIWPNSVSNPGPTFAREVAAADKDVTKSNSVIESKSNANKDENENKEITHYR